MPVLIIELQSLPMWGAVFKAEQTNARPVDLGLG